jgi:hypothetical protein
MEADEEQTAYDEVKFIYDEDNFDLFFPPRSDAIFKLVRAHVYGDGTSVEHVFICIDSFSLPAALEQTKAVGMTPSESAISFLESVNSAISILRKLNLTFNLHGSFLTDAPYEDLDDVVHGELNYDLNEDANTAIPGYEWSNLGPVFQVRDDIFCPAE